MGDIDKTFWIGIISMKVFLSASNYMIPDLERITISTKCNKFVQGAEIDTDIVAGTYFDGIDNKYNVVILHHNLYKNSTKYFMSYRERNNL